MIALSTLNLVDAVERWVCKSCELISYEGALGLLCVNFLVKVRNSREKEKNISIVLTLTFTTPSTRQKKNVKITPKPHAIVCNEFHCDLNPIYYMSQCIITFGRMNFNVGLWCHFCILETQCPYYFCICFIFFLFFLCKFLFFSFFFSLLLSFHNLRDLN